MKAIKVNADYESVLFKNKPLPMVNETLEFLAFFLDQRPVLTKKKYSAEYLDYVESITDRKPQTKAEGNFENWWGELKDLELEKKLNSKVMSAKINPDSFILNSIEDLPALEEKVYLAKNPFGMSGQNFSMVSAGRLENLEQMLKNGPVILEPFFDRAYDFSHYIYPNGVSICYENLVDKKFQYRGTVFKDYMQPTVNNLKFYTEVSPFYWNDFSLSLKNITQNFSTTSLASGFSIDSFIYRESNELKIRALSEVNYRRTMGQLAFELAIKFGGVRKFAAFLLTKSSELSFSELKNKLASIAWDPDLSRGVILLSPGDVRYDMFFLSAINESEGKLLHNELKQLLPDSEFSIQL